MADLPVVVAPYAPPITLRSRIDMIMDFFVRDDVAAQPTAASGAM